MDTAMVYEIIGYVASVLVAVSLMMRSVLRLRIINLIGSATFALYGFLIQAYPVGGMNTFIALINIYYLWQMTRSKAFFTMLETNADDAYLRSFLRFYADDIKRFYPNFELRQSAGQLVWFVLRDMVPVGLFIGTPGGDQTLNVQLDYVIPGYRDLKPAQFLYREEAARFHQHGIKRLCAKPISNDTAVYLRRMGFTESGGQLCREV